MSLVRTGALIALPILAALAGSGVTTPAHAYDDDTQALRVRDMLADPSVPLAWDRRHRREAWRYQYDDDRPVRRCGKRYYWDGDECVRRRR